VTPGDVVDAVIRHRGEVAIVTGPGALSGALYSRAHTAATIYNMDLGYAAATCLGVALATPSRRVIAIEGDGSAIAGLGALTTIARYRPANLAVIVVDNGTYGSTGEGWVRTATSSGTDLAAVARGCGIDADHVLVPTAETLDAAIATALRDDGPWVVVARVELDEATLSKRVRPRTGVDWADAATGFRHELGRTSRRD
jgi:thiamine pyrophosphate-dependent acetolactate synthase large subunit-like protein